MSCITITKTTASSPRIPAAPCSFNWFEKLKRYEHFSVILGLRYATIFFAYERKVCIHHSRLTLAAFCVISTSRTRHPTRKDSLPASCPCPTSYWAHIPWTPNFPCSLNCKQSIVFIYELKNSKSPFTVLPWQAVSSVPLPIHGIPAYFVPLQDMADRVWVPIPHVFEHVDQGPHIHWPSPTKLSLFDFWIFKRYSPQLLLLLL